MLITTKYVAPPIYNTLLTSVYSESFKPTIRIGYGRGRNVLILDVTNSKI